MIQAHFGTPVLTEVRGFLKSPKRIFICLPLVFSLGCQMAPTKTMERSESHQNVALAKVQILDDKKMDLQNVIIVDTRPRFEYELAKVPRSFHFEPQDWLLYPYRGAELLKQTSKLQRRLALKGVTPYTPVVVFGSGPNGQGQEYYAATLLSSLGVQIISIRSPQFFDRALLVRKTVPPLKNAPYWQEPLKHNISCAALGSSKAKKLVAKSDKKFWVYKKLMEAIKNKKPTCVVQEKASS